MKAWKYLGLLALTAAVVGACTEGHKIGSDDDDDGGNTTSSTSSTGGGGSTAASVASSATSSSVTSSSTTTSSSSTSGGGGSGSGVCMSPVAFDSGVYDGCLTEYCCTSFDPCNANVACAACLADPNGPGCSTNSLYQSFISCFDTNCAASICNSTLAYGSPNLNTCINNNCCGTYTPCEANTTCNACLQNPMLSGCNTNQLFQNYQACRAANCPDDICGSQIVFQTTYYNNSQDVNYDSIACAQNNCGCTDITACADPSMNGYLAMNDPEVAACLLCLAGDPNCIGGAVATAANAFNACFNQNCP